MMIAKLRKIIWSLMYRVGLTGLLSDETFVKMLFWFRLGRWLNLEHPVGFNEKIQWMKLYYRNPLMVQCADKFAVRQYVEQKVGSQYLVPCIGVYDSAEQIDWERLPAQFVIKATHGSGWNLICKDKCRLDIVKAKHTISKWLKKDFSKVGREWQYSMIKPRIVIEEFLRDEKDEKFNLKDYKVFTFAGICKYIWVDYYKEDSAGHILHLRNIYDTNWNWLPSTGSLFPCGEGCDVDRPKCLDELLSVAAELGKDFPHCRVDLYILGDSKIFFGELTFTCGNGVNEFFPSSFGERLGSFIELPKKF